MKYALLTASVAILAAAPAAAQVMSPAEYVMTAGASDLYERQSSQIVMASTADPKIRDFARMMISAHAKTTADVTAAAKQSRVAPMPPKLMPAQAELIAELTAETGAARDATYVAQQKAAHGQALAVQKAYAMDGTAPALKRAAANVVPVVQAHIDMLKTM